MKEKLHFYVENNQRHYFFSNDDTFLLKEFADFILYRSVKTTCELIDYDHPYVKEAEHYLNRFDNPYKYSLDNKRYFTFDSYSKINYGRKLVKVPIDAGFSCPNRDGSLSTLGCLYCGAGANPFPDISTDDLLKQYETRKGIYLKKWPDFYPMAYFQSYSNTYCSLEKMKEVYTPFYEDENIKGLVISTRADTLDREKVQYLNSLTEKKEIWVELGLQSVHNQTLTEMNRCESYEDFLSAISLLKDTNIKSSVHLINGWPTETAEMMLHSAREVGRLPIDAIKFHMLYVIKDTPLASNWPFELLSKEEYVAIVAEQLSLIREDIIIERLTGDGLQSELLGPDWSRKKVSVINDIDRYMKENNLYQGKYFTE